MGRIQAMIDHAVAIANDDSHGYSWADRWNVDRDCSSLMYDSADAAGYPVGRGEDKTRYTGTMIDDFSAAGFAVHDYDSFDEYPGCILLRDPWGRGGHTEMYLGDGMTVGAHIAETGDVYGEPGDQTGEEISIAPNPGNWDYILEPPAESEDDMGVVDFWGYKNESMNGDNDAYQLLTDIHNQVTRTDAAGHENPVPHDFFGRLNIVERNVDAMNAKLDRILAKL